LHTSPLLFDPLLIFLEVSYNLDAFTNTENLFHKRSQKYGATDFDLVLFLGSIFIFFPKFSKSLSKKLRDVDGSKNIRVTPLLPRVLIVAEKTMICLDKELIFQIMGAEIIISLAHPVVENL